MKVDAPAHHVRETLMVGGGHEQGIGQGPATNLHATGVHGDNRALDPARV